MNLSVCSKHSRPSSAGRNNSKRHILGPRGGDQTSPRTNAGHIWRCAHCRARVGCSPGGHNQNGHRGERGGDAGHHPGRPTGTARYLICNAHGPLDVGHCGAGVLVVHLESTPARNRPVVAGGVRRITHICTVGHGMGGTWTFTAGMVSNIYPSKQRRSVFQTQIPLNPGNSGSPIFNRHGVVVGEATAGIVEANNTNFSIRADVVLDTFPQLAKAACACIEILAGKDIPIFVDGAMVGKGPRVVAPARPGRHDIFAVEDGVMRKHVVTFPATTRIDLR